MLFVLGVWSLLLSFADVVVSHGKLESVRGLIGFFVRVRVSRGSGELSLARHDRDFLRFESEAFCCRLSVLRFSGGTEVFPVGVVDIGHQVSTIG